MNAFHRTAHSMATTISNVGRQRAPQDVTICGILVGGGIPPRYEVLVAGEKYVVLARTLECLKAGQTPEYLELEADEFGPEEE